MSFVYEQRIDSDPRSRFREEFWGAVENAGTLLAEKEARARKGLPLQLLTTEAHDGVDVSKRLLESVLTADDSFAKQYPELLYVFVAHVLSVPHIDLKDRARPPIPLSSELSNLLTRSFLPRVFLALEHVASATTLDGRVFATLLDAVLRTQDADLSSLLGPTIVSELNGLWKAQSLPMPHLATLRRSFPPVQALQQTDQNDRPPLSLLPFSHPLFDEELASIDIEADETDETEEEPASHLEFNTLYSDTQHWHNHKRAILPAHLGGSDSGPMTEWQRKKQLRSEQRFMSKLQWQAETLTGALGTPLQQMVIPSAAQAKRSRAATPASRAEVRVYHNWTL